MVSKRPHLSLEGDCWVVLRLTLRLRHYSVSSSSSSSSSIASQVRFTSGSSSMSPGAARSRPSGEGSMVRTKSGATGWVWRPRVLLEASWRP